MAIDRLAAADAIADGDQFAIGSLTNGDDRRVAASLVKAYVQADDSVVDDKITQYAAPSATGFTVAITDGSDSIWLVLTPTAGFAAGTITLPSVTNAVAKQEVLVNCTQAVTTLTVAGNGATVTGAPTTLAANAFFRLRFDDVLDTWYRVG
jgi:hypothetical protein